MANKIYKICDRHRDEEVDANDHCQGRLVFTMSGETIDVNLDLCEEDKQKIKDILRPLRTDEEGFFCEVCNRSFKNKLALSTHRRWTKHGLAAGKLDEDTVVPTKFKCPECEETFDSEKERNEHASKAHKPKRATNRRTTSPKKRAARKTSSKTSVKR